MGITGHRRQSLRGLRAHRRVGAFVALLAMALQLVGLFGHVHLRERNSSSLIAVAGVATQAASADHASLPSADDDALCAICLVGHLAGAVATASAPILFAPDAHQQRAPPLVAAASADDIPSSFWSRGPPAV